MNKKPPVKQTPVKPVAKPTPKPAPAPKPAPVVSPPAPPAPVWTRLELPDRTTSFITNVLANRAKASISVVVGGGAITMNYGTCISIVPPVGLWQEQVSNDGGKTFVNTAVKFNQVQAGANNTTSVNLTLDGGVGPQKLMRYLLNQESL